MTVFGLGKNLLFKSVLGHCDLDDFFNVTALKLVSFFVCFCVDYSLDFLSDLSFYLALELYQ